MSREIKFEVIQEGKIVATEFADPQFNGGAWCHYLKDDPEEIIHYGGYVQRGLNFVTRRQYTGLKDKKTFTDIYEGDILKRENGEVGDVLFRDGCFVLNRLGNWRNWHFIDWPSEYFTDCEVIGNIYENSELLEGAAKMTDIFDIIKRYLDQGYTLGEALVHHENITHTKISEDLLIRIKEELG